MPQLRNELNEDSIDSETEYELLTELERVIRNASRILGLVPDVLKRRGDVRHTAAIEVMTAQLTAQLDKNKRFAVQMVSPPILLILETLSHLSCQIIQPRPPSVASETTKLRSFQSLTYQKFLRAIEVA